MKLIYVCSAFSREEKNYKRALSYGKTVLQKGEAPVLPHTMFYGLLNENVYKDMELYLYFSNKVMKLCDEVWVFGKERTLVMKSEIERACTLDLPIKYIESLMDDRLNDSLSEIAKEYERLTCSFINGAIGQDIMFYLEAGLTKEQIIDAIKKSALKKATWNYAKAILESWRAKPDNNSKAANSEQDKKASGYDMDLFEKMLNSDI